MKAYNHVKKEFLQFGSPFMAQKKEQIFLDERTMEEFLNRLAEQDLEDDCGGQLRTVAPLEYLYQEYDGEAAIIGLTAPLMALHLRKYQLVETLCQKGYPVNPWEAGCIYVVSPKEIGGSFEEKDGMIHTMEETYDYTMGQMLLAHGVQFSESTIKALYQGSYITNITDAAYIDFMRDFIQNPLLGVSKGGLYDVANLAAYKRAVSNIRWIHQACPLILHRMCGDEMEDFPYYEMPAKVRPFYIELKEVLFDCFAISENDRKNVLRSFCFMGHKISMSETMDAWKEKQFLELFAKWRDLFLSDYRHFAEDEKMKAFFFYQCMCFIAPLVGVYHAPHIYDRETMKKAYVAVSPVFQKLHAIFDTRKKLYLLWESLYYSHNINALEKQMLWVLRNVMGFRISLQLADTTVIKLLLDLLNRPCKQIIESLEMVDGFEAGRVPEETWEQIEKQILEKQNPELLQLTLERGLIPKKRLEQMFTAYQKDTSLSDRYILMPCLLAFRAKYRMEET